MPPEKPRWCEGRGIHMPEARLCCDHSDMCNAALLPSIALPTADTPQGNLGAFQTVYFNIIPCV